MSRVVKVDQGDYVIKVRNNGSILLDPGSNGMVTITGNLNVMGAATEVNTQSLSVTDNIILLNNGETGAGVTVGTSGIEIERGTLNNAQILWNEAVVHYDPAMQDNVSGTFVARLADSNLTGLQLSTVVSGPYGLVFDLGNVASPLKIANSLNYETRVLDTNDIPNRKFVTDYVQASGGFAVVDSIRWPLTGSPTNRATVDSNSIDFIINSTLKGTFTSAGLDVNNVRLSGDTVTNTNAVNNLTLTSTNNNVEVKSIINLDNLEALSGSYSTSVVAGTTKIYTTASEGPGRTGIFFVNNSTYSGNAYNNDELVSKNRAVLLSILL